MPQTATAPTIVEYVESVAMEAATPETAAEQQQSKSMGEPFEVLLIEDNDDEIVMVQHTIKRAGLSDRPHVVRDGRAALDLLLGPRNYPLRRRPSSKCLM